MPLDTFKPVMPSNATRLRKIPCAERSTSGVMERLDRLTRLAGRNRLELLRCRFSDRQLFGINVFKVCEVQKCPSLRSVPRAHPHVRGIMHARGRTITIIDLAAALGHGASEGSPDEFEIVTGYSGHAQGYFVRKVERIDKLRLGRRQTAAARYRPRECLTAVTTRDNPLVDILDAERVLSEIVGWRASGRIARCRGGCSAPTIPRSPPGSRPA
jgi:two-component system chemotaxis response regulator CheV